MKQTILKRFITWLKKVLNIPPKADSIEKSDIEKSHVEEAYTKITPLNEKERDLSPKVIQTEETLPPIEEIPEISPIQGQEPVETESKTETFTNAKQEIPSSEPDQSSEITKGIHESNGEKQKEVKKESLEAAFPESVIMDLLPIETKTVKTTSLLDEIHEATSKPGTEPVGKESKDEPLTEIKEEILIAESYQSSETLDGIKESNEEKQKDLFAETKKNGIIPQPEIQISEITQEGDKPVNVQSYEQQPSEIPSGAELQKSLEDEISDKNSQLSYPANADLPNEKRTTHKPKKPYKKKSPTEEIKPIKQSSNDKKPAESVQKKKVNLGNVHKRRRKITDTQRKTSSSDDMDKEINDKISVKEEFTTNVEAPYVEIDIDQEKVYLILPKQHFMPNIGDKLLRELSYSIHINGERQTLKAKVNIVKEGQNILEEKRILLEQHLQDFKVTFPDEIKGGEYSYQHRDDCIYFFEAKENNRGIFCYLNDDEGNINPIPKKVIWILLHEDFELKTELGPGDIDEGIWIWNMYRLYRIDLSDINSLDINNIEYREEKSFLLEPTFYIEGEEPVNDDFYRECPLITGKTVKIISPYVNDEGWSVWIQNKQAGHRIIEEMWIGTEPLTLRLPEDLPCEFGEFQVDICQQNTRIPDETIFFRVAPFIQLEYLKELIIPDENLRSVPYSISIWLDSSDIWSFEYKGHRKIESKQKRQNFFEIEIPQEEEIFKFSLYQADRPETVVNLQISIPRLKWKTSDHPTWNDVLEEIYREHLVSGTPYYLQIRTNDLFNKYYLKAILDDNEEKLQEGGFKRKGQEYHLELNQFYDTIKHNRGSLTIRVEISKSKKDQILGSIETLFFASDLKTKQESKPTGLVKTITSEITNIKSKNESLCRSFKKRKSKGFSKGELISAGIDKNDVRRLKIHYDKRRKTSHQFMIDTLKSNT